jgi:hypothetical protein
MGHVFANGLGLFLVAAAVLSRLPNPRWHRGYLAILLFLFAVLGGWCFLFHYTPVFKTAISARAWMRTHPVPPAPPASCGFLFSKSYPPMEDFDALLQYGPLATPLGCPENIERFLLLHGRDITPLNPGNYDDVFTLSQTRAALQKIDAMQTILVPKAAFIPAPPSWDADQFASDYRFIRNQMLIPIRLVQRHPRFSPEPLLIARISKEFSVIGQFQDYQIMVKRASDGRVPAPRAGQ